MRSESLSSHLKQERASCSVCCVHTSDGTLLGSCGIFVFCFCFKSFLWVKIFEWIWATKGHKELVFESCFLVCPGPGFEVWAALWGFRGDSLLTAPVVPASPWLPQQQRLSWVAPGALPQRALTGRPQRPEETQGSSGSSSEQQDVQLVTCGQGMRGSCVQSLPRQD